MSNLKAIRFHFPVLFFIVSLVVFTYWRLPNTFFQQDEWLTLSFTTYYHSKGISGIIESFLPIDAMSHFSPLAALFAWYEYIFYYTNYSLYAWQSIILHVINSFLLYRFVFFWFKRRSIAIVAALFFAVNSIPRQAVTWVAAANSYEVPTALILLSLIFFQKFLLQDKNERKNLVISLFFLFISLVFHENGVFLFLFYPISFLLFQRQRRNKLSIYFFTASIILAISLFALIRIPFFFGLTSTVASVTDISRSPFAVYPYRLLSIGLKSFAGSIVPEKTLITISEAVVGLAYPQFLTPDGVSNPFIAQSIVFDLASYIITFAIVCFIIFIIRLTREKKIAEGMSWSLIFVPAALLPYGFVLGKAGYASIFDPKFYYVASIGVSVLVGLIGASCTQRFLTKKLFISAVFLFYILFHVYSTRIYVSNLQAIGTQRKALLTTIKSSYERLPRRVIFFMRSDKAYYGMPDNEKILPVQIGFGKMLMIWYQKTEQFPGCLYEEQFLIRLLEQGYKECGGRGFGFFRDYDTLFTALRGHKLAANIVIAYNWNSKKGEFSDITSEIRVKLANDLKYESRQ